MMQPHDFEDPTEYLNRLEMAVYAATTPKCPHCNERREPLPMAGTAWGIEHFHEPGCPNHEDSAGPTSSEGAG